jgi:ribosomal protein S6--L-glutamate ligase
MILSFHPCFVGDENILCAGRDINNNDLGWIQKADAVILPQGCGKPLYDMAAKNCPQVFPNYKARFSFPGKIGQARLFKEVNASFPETHCFLSLAHYHKFHSRSDNLLAFDLPFVFKFDWGGESDNVLLIDSLDQQTETLRRAADFEKTGQCGFLIQEFIPSANRSLRVAVIGTKRIAYWRVQPNQKVFSTGVSKGATIDKISDAQLQATGIKMVDRFCAQTGINLAGIDVVFSDGSKPLGYFLEINYFFGRAGLGGSEKYLETLHREINLWLERIGLPSTVSMQ